MQNAKARVVAALLLTTGYAGFTYAQGLGTLQRVGSLQCTATEAKGAATSKLNCRLRFGKSQRVAGRYDGVVFGRGLYLVSPKGTQVEWNVLSPVKIAPEDLEGDYDIVSKHSYRYERRHNRVLVGGRNDLVALELIAPRADAITASTRLTLRTTR